MESEIIQIGSFKVKCYSVNTLITGSGAAALNAAISLRKLGQENIVIATAGMGSGTSNNAGSDKQTYYKLSLAGEQPDSVAEMTKDLFSGHCMHGDIALCEAQGSVRAFMRLVELGVPFPYDKHGSWAGYKTDHDPRARATSAGPRTSGMIFGVLAEEIRRLKVKILNHHQVIALLTDKKKTRTMGALAINMAEKDPHNAFVLFNSVNIILGTGGPGDIYRESVYPISQTSATGMAFIAGASGQNLTESQFGIASTGFRWNLSGSYQQVVPRYISTDKQGRGETEFLNNAFPDYRTLTRAIFRKGYQWPFDPAKVVGYGSSLIDLLVFRERNEKGRRVFIDYTKNPAWKGGLSFSPHTIDPEVRDYLAGTDSFQETPYGRLLSLNRPAFDLYSDNRINLSTEPLEIAVCAQHNNGGLTGNLWWESNIRHLFPVGEINGTHGVYRPGGSALNSGQVGSFRAALYISRKYNQKPDDTGIFIKNALERTESVLELAEKIIENKDKRSNRKILDGIKRRMSDSGGIIRSLTDISKSIAEAQLELDTFADRAGAHSVTELAGCLRIYDNCITHLVYLKAIRTYIEKGGRSRGSYLVTQGNKDIIGEIISGIKQPELCGYDRDIENDILELTLKDNRLSSKLVKVREIPGQNLWFERVWKDYLADNFIT